LSVLTPEFLSLVPELFSTDTETTIAGLKGLLRLAFAQELSATEEYLMLGYSLSVPPYVRQELLSRSIDNDDLLPNIRKPVLITHGAADAIVKLAAVDQYRAAMPHAQVQLMASVGHAAFWDDAAGFNERLRAFCESL
jgi:non-heme chloroperoxidase